jgi:hypothetical protein
MKRVLLIVVFLGAAVAVRADSTTIGLASLGTSADSGQMNSLGSTVAIAPHPGWAPALPGSSWVSFGVTGNPTAPGYFVVPNGTVVAFNQNFFIPGTVDSGWLTVMGDDSLAVLLNGNTLLLEAPSSGNTYATCSDFGAGCLPSTQVTLNLTPYLKTGDNTLQFLVAQRAGASFGLNYAGEIHDPSPVPEPATILMLATGLCGVIGTARRKLRR